ncbi:MAG: RsmD family RNA methyltransferase [Planctomycetes bacterium]|nr:RsmD family RNA methyltransferase [Planctomycetota bacterium]
MMRIIAGSMKGRRLIAPPGLETRPLPDRIKQSLFDWLGQDLSGRSVADVCAGSGAFGCEALSRGAEIVHLIEPGRHAQSALRANLLSLGNPPQLVLHPRPFQSVLPSLRGLDLVFCDPPFPWFQEEPQTLIELIALAKGSVARGGAILVRGERGQELPTLPFGLRQEEKRLYGRSWVARLVLTGGDAALRPA